MAEAEDLTASSVLGDLQRLTTPTAVVETHTIDLGGVPQVVSIRGRRRDNPVLVMLHGGPGTPLSGTSWMWQRPVEEYLTVVQHDQRAAGRSHGLTAAESVEPTLRVEQYVADAVELVEWVCAHLGVDRVVLAGHSWGTVVATRAALARPDLLHGYLGIGQIVSMQQGERASWEWVRAEAERRGDTDAVSELDALLPYPGEPAGFLEKVMVERGWVQRYGGFAAGRGDCDYYFAGNSFSPDWSAADVESAQEGNGLSGPALLPALLEVDVSVDRFPVPMVQFLGRADFMTPTAPVLAWLDRLVVPSLAVEWFEDSAHMAMYEEPGHFLVALLEHVLPLTAAQSR